MRGLALEWAPDDQHLEQGVSPTVYREQGFRFFFFSREETRPHIHVQSERGEAKLWLLPAVEVALSHGLTDRDVRLIRGIVEGRRNEFLGAWYKHFGG